MAQPNWITPAGTLGTFPSSTPITIQLNASPVYPATSVRYQLLNGNLPAPMQLDYLGVITGTPNGVSIDTVNNFTIRAVDEFNNIRDRSFNIVISTAATPQFIADDGIILTVNDSVYVDYQVLYTVPIENDITKILLTAGSLPPGLSIDELGSITGYAQPPLTNNGSPAYKTFSFTLTLISTLGTTTANYVIGVLNFQLTNPPNTRTPVILNSNPVVTPVPNTDPYFDYYVDNYTIPMVKSGDFFAFKILGLDFDESPIGYSFSALPSGLVGDPETGWISGIPVINRGLSSFQFQVGVFKKTNSIKSQPIVFTMVISNEVVPDVKWETPNELGVIFNNTISDLSVIATSAQNLIYRMVSGSLPGNLTLASDGQILGKVAFQPTETLLNAGDSSDFSFTVQVVSPLFPLVESTRTFNLTVFQFYAVPTETIYFKAAPSLTDRAIINSLLTDEDLIPSEYVYRSEDINFGKASSIICPHAFGIDVGVIEDYVKAVQKNHYWRQLILGELKTAVARDANGNIIYEVVYSEVQDDLVNSKGESAPLEIIWPRAISESLGPWITSAGRIYSAYDQDKKEEKTYFTSLSPGYIRKLYPASFENMRIEAAKVLAQDFNPGLLPRWMASQQPNGDILGYINAWVICYTIPGVAQEVVDNINNNWDFELNEINFVVDRYCIDKSSTFNYNTNLEIPTWNKLPSGFPTPNPINSQDFYALFPQKTILPK